MDDYKRLVASEIVKLYPPPKYIIAKEEIPQGVSSPFFFIKQISQDYTKLIGNRYKSGLLLSISYYPPNGIVEVYKDLEEVQLNLLRAFSSSNIMRMSKIQSKIVDKILHITGEFNFREIAIEDGVPMKSLDVETDMKEENE